MATHSGNAVGSCSPAQSWAALPHSWPCTVADPMCGYPSLLHRSVSGDTTGHAPVMAPQSTLDPVRAISWRMVTRTLGPLLSVNASARAVGAGPRDHPPPDRAAELEPPVGGTAEVDAGPEPRGRILLRPRREEPRVV